MTERAKLEERPSLRTVYEFPAVWMTDELEPREVKLIGNNAWDPDVYVAEFNGRSIWVMKHSGELIGVGGSVRAYPVCHPLVHHIVWEIHGERFVSPIAWEVAADANSAARDAMRAVTNAGLTDVVRYIGLEVRRALAKLSEAPMLLERKADSQ